MDTKRYFNSQLYSETYILQLRLDNQLKTLRVSRMMDCFLLLQSYTCLYIQRIWNKVQSKMFKPKRGWTHFQYVRKYNKLSVRTTIFLTF
jgi:hypothetical protein